MTGLVCEEGLQPLLLDDHLQSCLPFHWQRFGASEIGDPVEKHLREQTSAVLYREVASSTGREPAGLAFAPPEIRRGEPSA
jgi:hypothetical protein